VYEYESAVDAFLRGAAPPPPFSVAPVGAYRALCLPVADGEARLVALLAGEEGAVYAPAPGEPAPGEPAPGTPDLEAILRRQRFRPTGTTLALRLPTAVTGLAPRPARFVLWASPAYLAAGGAAGGAVWK
jgi:hypothetical protein